VTRGRKRKFDTSIPGHIDQKVIPAGCYWHRRDRYWYTKLPYETPAIRRLCGEDAMLSDLHHAMELLGGVEKDTLKFLLDAHQASDQYAELADTTKEDYANTRRILDGFVTKIGMPFPSLKLSKIKLPLIQVLIDDIAAGKRRHGDTPAERTPSSAAHVQRYLSAAFAWGMPRGLCAFNAAEGVAMPKERKAHRMPSRVIMRACVALFKRRGALPTRTKGSLPPYVWAVAVIAYACRMRNIEVRSLTDADETDDGIIVDRRKGSLGNTTEWSPELREAWDWLKIRRTGIWAKKRLPSPLRPDQRPLVVNEQGQRVSKSTMASAWRRAMAAAMAAGLIDASERFGLHGLKHRGVTDTEGTKADKQQASGHRNMQMVNHYDHERPVVKPANKA
jgi:hypothetical protein